MSFTFDPEAHEYRLQGHRLEHITEILAPLLPTEYYTQEGRDRGRLVHDIISGDAELTPETEGYCEAWESFSGEHGLKVYLQEEPLYHPTLLYAGTPDVFGNVTGLGDTIVEVKTGAAHPATALQTAAQEALIRDNKHGKPRSRIGVHLREDGRYFIEPYKGHSDMAVFRSLLNVHRWKKRHNIR